MARTSTDARRHIRELGEFFRDIKIVTETAASEFIKQHEKRKFLQQALSRLIKRGLIKKEENKLSLTQRGYNFFLRRQPIQKYQWQGKWVLISFDVPVKSNSDRNQLRTILQDFNFYQLHKSVYICPYIMSKDFLKLLTEYDLEKYCRLMIVEIIEGDKEIKRYFGIK